MLAARSGGAVASAASVRLARTSAPATTPAAPQHGARRRGLVSAAAGGSSSSAAGPPRATPRPLSAPRQRLPRSLRVRATIPAPEPPAQSDLGWPTDFAQHYVKGKLIGQGSFGSVFLGIDLHTGKEVAVKVMPKQRGKLTKERTLQKLAKEVGILQKMQSCRNTVRLLGCFEGADEVMVVTGLCSGGDLQKLSDDHGALPERAVALIAYEVLQVVEKCHELGILHGDLKPANFVLADRTKNPLFSKDINLLFGAPWLLAIDFGCSQYLGSARFSKRTGTPVYMAPEIFDRDYYWEADMWSLGIMLYQLYARRFPYWRTYEECRHAKLDEVAVLVAESPLPMDYGPWKLMSPEGLDFMAGCLERDYQQRMTVTQALNHPWLMQWLPEDDISSLDVGSLESIGTSSEEEEPLQRQRQAARAPQQAVAAAAAQQQQQHHAAGQPGQAEAAAQQLRAPCGQQHVVMLPQQPQQHMVLTPQQLQQQLASSSQLGNAPGAYSSNSASDGASAAGSPPPAQQQQQQQHHSGTAPQQQHLGSRQQQAQPESAGAAAAAASTAGAAKGASGKQ